MADQYADIDLEQLAHKYKAGTLSSQELTDFENWYNSHNDSEFAHSGAANPNLVKARMFKQLLNNMQETEIPQIRKIWPRIAVAAAAVAAITLSVWLYTSRQIVNPKPPIVTQNDVAPGKNTATLTMGNGKVYQLSDAKTGVVIGTELKYNDGSTIGQPVLTLFQHHPNLGQDLKAATQLTITTPRGGQYQVRLPDGTKVWLNAASSLTYSAPLNERGGVRQVELSGEAYFEVFRNKKQPFVVKSKKMELTVLGTHFNVNAYEDERNTKTTLLEGSVRIANLSAQQIVNRKSNIVHLLPNQQAIITNTSTQVKEVDATESIDWKNGDFVFKNDDFKSIMRKVARWYDVEIIYDKTAPEELPLGGLVSRTKNISAILKIMEATGDVHFKIEGRRITVTR